MAKFTSEEVVEIAHKLERADLRKLQLGGANLAGANLRESNLQGANLQGVDLRDADLRGANLNGANLYLSKLNGANLRAVTLRQANLQWADLREAILVNASLCGANLRDADLTHIKVHLRVRGYRARKHSYFFTHKDEPMDPDHWSYYEPDFSDAIYNKNTKFPYDFDPEASGMLLKE